MSRRRLNANYTERTGGETIGRLLFSDYRRWRSRGHLNPIGRVRVGFQFERNTANGIVRTRRMTVGQMRFTRRCV